MNSPLTKLEKEKLHQIFNPYGMPLKKCDCETCPYEKECEQDNPDFDANYCKVNQKCKLSESKDAMRIS